MTLTIDDSVLLRLHSRLVVTPEILTTNERMLDIRASRSHDNWIQFALRTGTDKYRCRCVDVVLGQSTDLEKYRAFYHICSPIQNFTVYDLLDAYDWFSTQYREDMDLGNDSNVAEWIDFQEQPPADVCLAALIELARHILHEIDGRALPSIAGAPPGTVEPR